MNQNIQRIMISIAIPLMIGGISGYFTITGIESWYMTLEKPNFNPPNWIFGPVWSTLYFLIGISFFLIWKNAGAFSKITKKELSIYSVQLLLNFTWSIIFFGLETPGGALINIAILWGVILVNILIFYQRSKFSGLLLIPYLLWVSFASVLNYYIWILN